jgi:hypothetical protein
MDTREEIKFCEHCGAKLNGRWESLSAGLANTLIKFYGVVVAKNRNSVHLQKEVGFTKNEYNNFQKLKYFGLVVPVEEKAGFWLITHRGGLFIHNEMPVNKKVYVFRNRILERSGETIFIKQAVKTDPYWLQKDDFIYGAPEQEGLF